MSDEVASLELSKELYELTEWNDTDYVHEAEDYDGKVWHVKHRMEVLPPSYNYPAYTLGYLLRKLPPHYAVWIGPSGSGYAEQIIGPQRLNDIGEQGDTPENAAAKLCIELIKQGVIKP
jgi:hypothetical protein